MIQKHLSTVGFIKWNVLGAVHTQGLTHLELTRRKHFFFPVLVRILRKVSYIRPSIFMST